MTDWQADYDRLAKLVTEATGASFDAGLALSSSSAKYQIACDADKAATDALLTAIRDLCRRANGGAS